MSERFVLGAYWGARRESVEQCADRLQTFFEALLSGGDLLSQWYPKASSPKKSLEHPLDRGNSQMLIEILMKGQNRANAQGAVSEDLGVQVGFWNGKQGEDQASFSLRCGLYWKSSNASASVGNCVVFDLPKNLGILSEPLRMVELLAETARAWNPDWAGVMSESSMLTRGFDAEEPFVDWMVYVPRRLEKVAEPSFLRQLEAGSIVVVQPTPPSATELSSLAHIERVGKAIQRP